MFEVAERIKELIGVLKTTSTEFRQMVASMNAHKQELAAHRRSLDANTKALGGTPPRSR